MQKFVTKVVYDDTNNYQSLSIIGKDFEQKFETGDMTVDWYNYTKFTEDNYQILKGNLYGVGEIFDSKYEFRYFFKDTNEFLSNDVKTIYSERCIRLICHKDVNSISEYILYINSNNIIYTDFIFEDTNNYYDRYYDRRILILHIDDENDYHSVQILEKDKTIKFESYDTIFDWHRAMTYIIENNDTIDYVEIPDYTMEIIYSEFDTFKVNPLTNNFYTEEESDADFYGEDYIKKVEYISLPEYIRNDEIETYDEYLDYINDCYENLKSHKFE